VGSDFLRVHHGGLLHSGEKFLVGPPSAVEDHDAQEDSDDDGAEAALLAFVTLPQLSQLIVQAQDDVLELGVIVCGVAEVIFSCEPRGVFLLELSPLGLVVGGVGMGGFARQVELVYRLVAAAAFAGNDDPGFFPWRRA
jgi:hypothetical protein